MSLAVAGFENMIPVLGAAFLLPSTLATALRLEEDMNEPGTVPPEVDALLQRILESADLDIGGDLGSLHIPAGRRRAPAAPRTTLEPGADPDEDSSSSSTPRPGALDTWSVVWYCGMFAAFTSLFLIMPCSQVLCRAGLLQGQGDPRLRPRPPLGAFHAGLPQHGYGTPPPPYKQFAPPSYEDVIVDLQPPGKAVPVGHARDKPEKPVPKLDVFVIPLRHDAAATTTTSAASEGVA